MAKQIQLKNVRKEYNSGKNTITAVNDMNIEIPQGYFTTLVGPSGCGKTTTLRMMAGLETPTSGEIFFDEDDVTEQPPQERDISMVFQNIALYPHMTVRENIGYGLKIDGVPKQKRNKRVKEAANLLQIGGQLDKKPAELSGGQQQRVALGSVFVEQPEILLLDEPMSDLDAKLKAELRVELQRLHQRLDVTTVYVTHDQTEAMTMSDHVALLKQGSIEQFAPPTEMFNRPKSEYVATFMGTPSTNVLRCELIDNNDELTVNGPGISFSLPKEEVPFNAGNTIKIGIRPQYLSLQGGQHSINVSVDVIEPLGTESVIHAKTPDDKLFDIVTDNVQDIKPGNQIEVGFDLEDVFFFTDDGESIGFRDDSASDEQTVKR